MVQTTEAALDYGDFLQIWTHSSGKGGPGQAPVSIPPLEQTKKLEKLL